MRVIATRTLKLLCAGGLTALVWLWLLPSIADHPAQRRRWLFLQQHRIDPSAMYYTELEAMQPILERLNRQQRLE